MSKHAEHHCPQIRQLIEQGRIHDAYLLAIGQNPQDKNPFMRGIDEADMRRALEVSPAALSFLGAERLREVQIRLALMYAGCHSADREPVPSWPYRMSSCIAVQILCMAAEISYSVKDWRRSRVVEEVRVVCSGEGPCAVCAGYRDRGPYPLDTVPIPPFTDCLCLYEHGCRCILVAAKIKGVQMVGCGINENEL